MTSLRSERGARGRSGGDLDSRIVPPAANGRGAGGSRCPQSERQAVFNFLRHPDRRGGLPASGGGVALRRRPGPRSARATACYSTAGTATVRPLHARHAKYTGMPARMIANVIPVLTGSVQSAFTTMATEASRKSSGTTG